MKHGFSLVELSIVLVILGLLTGGILAGQNLIRAAELRSVTTQRDQILSAVHTFRDKYFALPGDMRNAEDFWGTMATGTCPAATAGTGTQTCNGNGNGTIDLGGSAGQAGEVFTFWQHLANAGLLEGSYTGIAGGVGHDSSVIAENIPASKLSNGGWYTHSSNTGYSALYFDIWSGIKTYLMFGRTTTGRPLDAIMTNEELWNIDTKADDGLPLSGNTVALYRAGCTTASSKTDVTNIEYNLSSTATVCALLFLDTY